LDPQVEGSAFGELEIRCQPAYPTTIRTKRKILPLHDASCCTTAFNATDA
jgi:hypothetical protein